MRTTLLSLSLIIAPVLPLFGVPAPAPDDDAAKKEAVVDEKKGPGFLGVSAGEIPAALATQLKLEHGVKLLTVSPDSPAGKAGFNVDDIITAVGEKNIDTMLELRDAIRAHKVGDEVTLKMVQKGVHVVKKVTLAEAPVLPQLFLPQGGLQLGGGFQGGNLQLNFGDNGRGRFKMGDQDGSVEVKGDGEAREVTVWDLSNKVVYEGPWVTPQDKAAPSAQVRKRIERVDNMFAGRRNFLQERRVFPPPPPAPVPAPAPAPAEPDDEPEEDLPKPKVEDGEIEKGEPE